MYSDHKTKTFTGINRQSTEILFEQMREEGYDVDFAHFKKWESSHYSQHPTWFSGGAFRAYFARFYSEGRCDVFERLVAKYNANDHKRSEDAYADAPRKVAKARSVGTKLNRAIAVATAALTALAEAAKQAS